MITVKEEEVRERVIESIKDEMKASFYKEFDIKRGWSWYEDLKKEAIKRAVDELYNQVMQEKTADAMKEISASQLASAILIKASQPTKDRY